VVLQIDTLQHLRNAETMLRETARVGKLGIVAFPNFAHWPNRLSILRGRMPVTKRLPYQWYDTPNIRVGTFKDFEVLATRNRLVHPRRLRPAGRRGAARAAESHRQHRGLQVRARDAVAQALLGATLVPLVRQRSLRCTVPYALEGLVRRELAAAGAVLESVAHGDDVAFAFSLPEPDADAFIARLGDAAQGRAAWPRE
jgi:hypothetical protein